MQFLLRTAAGGQQLRWASSVQASVAAHLAIAAIPDIAHLNDEQIAALGREKVLIDPLIAKLGAVYVPYRSFLDAGFVEIRAHQRVADYLCDNAQTDTNTALSNTKDEVARHIEGGIKAIQGGYVLSRVLRAGREATAGLAKGAAVLLAILPERTFPTVKVLAARLARAGGLMDQYLRREADEVESQRPGLRAAVRAATNDVHEAFTQMNGRLRTHFSDVFIDSLYPQLKERGAKVADAPDDDEDVIVEPAPEPPAGPATP